MKLIFLDIDGVLNCISQGHDKHGGIFHEHLVDNLRKIVDETDAKIVISSTWRYSGLQAMRDMWSDRGYPGDVIGITIDSVQIVDLGICEFYDLVDRGHEIQHWLDNHDDIDSYVILDDDNDMLDSQRGNFVRTSNNPTHPGMIDIGYGLTEICANEAIKILNKK